MIPRWLQSFLSERPDGRAEPIAPIEQFEIELEARLDARKALRQQRSEAARKGHQTRRAKA